MKFMNVAKKYGAKVVAAPVALLASASAFATGSSLPAGVTEAFTAMDGAITAFEALVWPVLITATISFFGIRLFKKFRSSAL